MSLVRTIARKSLLGRPGRTIFSILGVGLGIAIAVAVFTLDHNTVLGLSLPGLQDWKPALEVRPTAAVRDPRADLAKTEGVSGVSAMFQNEVSVRRVGGHGAAAIGSGRVREHTAPGEDRVQARLFALESAALGGLEAVSVAEGRPLEPKAAVREALVGTELADALGIAPGERVLLSRPARGPRKGCVEGEIRVLDSQESSDVPREESFEVVGVLAREKLGKRSQGMVVVVDYQWGQDLYRGSSLDPVYWVRQDPAIDVERLKASLARSFSYELNKSVIVGAAAQERAFRNGVRMAGLLALVLGLYVIFHTLSIALIERVREISVLHALGASRFQIARIFLAEAGVIAGAAAVVGIGLGLLLARVLLLAGITTLGSGHRIRLFDIPWTRVLQLAGLGVGMALLGSVYPLLRAWKSSPVAALHGDPATKPTIFGRGFHALAAVLLALALPGLYFMVVPVVGEAQSLLVGAVLAAVGILALLVVVPLLLPSVVRALSNVLAHPLRRAWIFSGRMASFSIRESGTRVAVSAAGIALVAAAFVGLKGMTASLRGEIVTWADEALVDKVYLSRLPPTPLPELRKLVETVPGVVAIENGSARTYVPFLMLGMNAAELARFGPCQSDPAVAAAIAKGDGVILSKQLARHLEYRRGDFVHVGNSAGAVQDLEVVAISDVYGYFPHPDERLYGVVGDGFIRRAFCLDVTNVTECALVLAPGADADAVKGALRRAVPESTGVEITTGPGMLVSHLADLERDFRLFDLILGLTALLAALGVLNGLLLSALERTKELGVLRALGASRRQIAGMVLAESAIVGVLGGLVGTALGAALTPVIIRALEALSGLDLPEVTAGWWLAWVPAGAIVVSLVASLVPIRRMNRTDPVAAVRTG